MDSQTDLFTRTIWGYFVRLNCQHTKIKNKNKTFINISGHVFGSLVFQSGISSVLGFRWCSLLTSHRSVGFCIALCGVSALILGQFNARLVFPICQVLCWWLLSLNVSKMEQLYIWSYVPLFSPSLTIVILSDIKNNLILDLACFFFLLLWIL